MDKKKRKYNYKDYEVSLQPKNLRRGRNGILFPSSKNYHEDNEIMFSEFDPFGSYTGISENDFDRPIQDADDL